MCERKRECVCVVCVSERECVCVCVCVCVCTVVWRPDQLVAAEAHLRRQEKAELFRLQSDAPVVRVHHLLHTHTHTVTSCLSNDLLLHIRVKGH